MMQHNLKEAKESVTTPPHREARVKVSGVLDELYRPFEALDPVGITIGNVRSRTSPRNPRVVPAGHWPHGLGLMIINREPQD